MYGTKYRNDHTGRLSWFISAFDGHGQEFSYWVQGERSHEVAMHMTVNRSSIVRFRPLLVSTQSIPCRQL